MQSRRKNPPAARDKLTADASSAEATQYFVAVSVIPYPYLRHATRILIYSTYPLSIQAHPPRPDAVAIPEKSEERKESAHALAGTPKQQCHNYPHAPYATLSYANTGDWKKLLTESCEVPDGHDA